MSCVHRYLQMTLQCETMFGDHRCQGVKGHGGCCQDIDYQCVEGEQYNYINGKNWCELQLSNNSRELIDNMEVKNMVQAQYSETFLKGESIIELGITKLKILDEGSYVKGNYGEQLQVRVLANDKEKKKFKWSLGAKANDTLISLFGKDTSEWVGKEIEVATEQNKSGKPSVIVTSKPQGKLGV
uniref:ORF75 n=1 Tax=Nitrosopumilaceae spindle-shaped virus TaxID=3065433 RepID=A0AAT9JAP8_9VIRU